MPSDPILTYDGNHLLSARNDTDSDALLEDGDSSVFGALDPDAVLVRAVLARLLAQDDTLVQFGASDETLGDIMFGYLDPPAVLEWGGVVSSSE